MLYDVTTTLLQNNGDVWCTFVLYNKNKGDSIELQLTAHSILLSTSLSRAQHIQTFREF